MNLLLKNLGQTKKSDKVFGAMLSKEILRLAVISMLLKLPLRKGAFEALVIDTTKPRWWVKLSADDRKSGSPINKPLSR